MEPPGLELTPRAADAVNGKSFINDGRIYLAVRNSGSSSHSVTIQGKSYAVPAGQTAVLGAFPNFQQFGDTVTATADNAAVFLTAVSLTQADSAKR